METFIGRLNDLSNMTDCVVIRVAEQLKASMFIILHQILKLNPVTGIVICHLGLKYFQGKNRFLSFVFTIREKRRKGG